MKIINGFKDHQVKWERMAALWNEFTKPGRPSKDDIENYRKLIANSLKGKTSPMIVVLGATPEIRDMLMFFVKKQNARIICTDMTKDMFNAMSGLVKHKNNDEKFIKANWLELSDKIKSGSVDVVIGDYVIGNVGGNEDVFLKEISKILKDGGSFITRAQIMDGISAKFDLHRDFLRICKYVKKKNISIKEASSYFANNVILYSWYLNEDNKTSLAYLDSGDLKNLEEKIRLSKNKIENKVWDCFYNSWYLMKDKHWTNYNKNELEEILKKHFQIGKTLYSNDYEITKQSPIYLLIKK